jgi:uncharacterized protein with NAD-binding domain and iron-sulfur cluster
MLERPERIAERFPLVQDPPFALQDTRAFLLALPCDEGRIAAMLDRTFGWARPGIVVRPLGPICLLVFTDVGRASAANPAFGSFSYREATVFVPVCGERNGEPFVAMHVPFIYPNEGLAVAAGREVYGFPKKPGIVDIPSDDDFWGGKSPLGVHVLSAERFDGSAWAKRRLIRADAEAHQPRSGLERDLHEAIHALLAPVPHLLGDFSGLLRQDLLQLKQVPDVSTGGLPPRALYRAIVRNQAPVESISDVRLADGDKVTVSVADLASEPLRDVLGVPAVVQAKVAASLTMSFRFEPGEIWREDPHHGKARGRKTRVLILGGGMSALATAHALTDTEERRARFDVHVLTQGHLLGGKGASTRDPALGMRNQEHGIHVFFGFYHNALALMRGVYEEAARPAGVFPRTFDDAFRPEWEIAFDNGTDTYEITFPKTPSGWGVGLAEVFDEVKALEQFAASAVRGPLSELVKGLIPRWGNPMAREVVAFVLTLAAAVTTDIVVKRKTWEELDRQDFREWMLSHRIIGMPDLASTAIMQVPYDGVFAYVGKDQKNPRLGAGIAARGLLKLAFQYEVAPYFAMAAGMGECVFAPLYEVLKSRGVRFEFFAKVKELRIEAGRATLVRYGRQATVKGGPFAYEPLFKTRDIPAWKPVPDTAQLSDDPLGGADPYSDATTAQVGPDATLSVDADFDWVVCALPAPVTASVLRGHEDISDLARIANIPTVATLHLQTWFTKKTQALGWPHDASVLGGFPQPLNSMHVRDQFLGIESWPPPAPKGLLYLSGPFGPGWDTDSSDQNARDRAAKDAALQARSFVSTELGKALPRFSLGDLYAPHSPSDPMADQYIRANIDKSARYVLCVPGGLANRPGAEPAGVSNLRLAGDWTKNGIDIPCIEGTVVSALRATQTILGAPLLIL